MAAGQSEVYDVLGYGSYGAVIQPALKNINANGKPIDFPGMVTKIFFREQDLRKALSDAEIIQDKFPGLAIEYSPYKKKYVLSDFDSQPVIIKALLTGITDMGAQDPILHTIRMPYLGESIANITRTRDRTLLKQYYALSPEKMIIQVLKLLTIVETLVKAEYIHGDIRDANILVNPETGDLTIIDFDFLAPFETALKKFNGPKEWLPLEVICFLGNGQSTLEKLLTLPLYTPVTRNDYTMKMERFVDTHIPPVRSLRTMNQALKDTMLRLYGHMKDMELTPKEAAEYFKRECLLSLDAYGLAGALLYLFHDMPRTGAYDPLYRFLHTILIPHLSQLDVFERKPITLLIRVTKQFIAKYHPTIRLEDIPGIKDETARLALLATTTATVPADVASSKRSSVASVKAVAAAANAAAPMPDNHVAITVRSAPRSSRGTRRASRRSH